MVNQTNVEVLDHVNGLCVRIHIYCIHSFGDSIILSPCSELESQDWANE